MSSFWPTEEQEAIREAVGRICADFDDEYWRRTDETGDFPEAFAAARAAGGWLGVAMPEAPDYTHCLRHLLHRRVWLSTLGAVRDALAAEAAAGDVPAVHPVFIKPAADAKAFSAIVEPQDQMLSALLDGIPGVLPPGRIEEP
jgi:alkylation response protein AidB-like acyl-CoA dehydrogenase